MRYVTTVCVSLFNPEVMLHFALAVFYAIQHVQPAGKLGAQCWLWVVCIYVAIGLCHFMKLWRTLRKK